VSSPFAWAPSFKESYHPRIKQNVSPETKTKSRRLRETNAASELRTDSTSKPGMEGGRSRDRTERVSMPSVAKEQRDRTIHPEDKKTRKPEEVLTERSRVKLDMGPISLSPPYFAETRGQGR